MYTISNRKNYVNCSIFSFPFINQIFVVLLIPYPLKVKKNISRIKVKCTVYVNYTTLNITIYKLIFLGIIFESSLNTKL